MTKGWSIQSTLNKLKQLSQYKDFTEEELIELAKIKSVEWDKYFDVKNMFFDKVEQKYAKELMRKYLQDYQIETISDKNLLKQLVFLEVINIRLQEILNDLQKSAQGKSVVNLDILDALHKNLKEIVNLKDKLGISKDKLQQQQDDAFKALDLLKKKFYIWRQNNQASRTLSCPYCGQMILLKIRTDIWEAQKHPFFKDRILGNEHLVKLYLSNKITKQDVAKILEVHPDYVDWLIKKWKLNGQNYKQS